MATTKQPTVIGRGLGGELRVLREGRKMSLKEVADLLGWQASKISRMETGKQGIRPADVASLLVVYRVTGRDRDRLVKLAERSEDTGYWENQPALSAESKTLMRIEREASEIVIYEPLLIPGLVQTGDYVRALMRAGNVSAEDVDARVAARLARQAVLTKDTPPKLKMIVDEFVLRRVLGNPKIMARQLRHVLESVERGTTSFQVLPLSLFGHSGLDGSYTLMEFVRNLPVVYLDHKISGLFLEEPAHIEFFRDETDTLSELALSPVESAELVATIAREHDRE
ncbi:helix-turn-helix domain-containing protein [Actinokineospora globicatena]|uniref:helix-turn-helix domain-containing protein n=1 Tax=Actinokineospora globicatena TaxID=103729 RepID=UPI0020A57C1E|nr:helix-turn-helix transcriptional regulator [Actinokineospora globicatena]MCP2305235.1 Helix-turn-helix domain-containing protein [Actinokineospora globicatena]GLW80710.1 transcriptional regulator [Actinokineospora globicatena]GLW87537.1 transcriptional regulator [Actinokineospora globicatena]